MALTAAQITTLATELHNDPDALGYAPYNATQDVDSLIAILSFIRDGVTACPINNVVGPAITGVRNTAVKVQDIIGAIAVADLITAGIATQPTAEQFGEFMLFQTLCNDGTVNLTNADGSDNNNAKTLKKILAAGSASKTAVAALETRNGSRAEQLFGLSGIVLTEADLYAAFATGQV